MLKMIGPAALALLLLGTASSYAACNSICRQKCEATAAAAGSTVELCIQKWSYINSQYGKRASQFEFGRSWNRSLCQRQCRIGYKVARYASVAACIEGIPCSKYSE